MMIWLYYDEWVMLILNKLWIMNYDTYSYLINDDGLMYMITYHVLSYCIIWLHYIGIYNHLQLMSKTSKSKLFLSVNKELVNRIEYKVKVWWLE